MRRQPLRVVAAGAASLVVGCGSSASSSQLSPAAADRMNEALVATRAAADAGNREKAMGALTVLSEIVSRESRAGHLSAADERALRAGIAQARRRVALDVEAPAPQPAPAQQSAPAPQTPPREKDDKPGKEDEDDGEDKEDKQDKRGKPGKGNGKGRD